MFVCGNCWGREKELTGWAREDRPAVDNSICANRKSILLHSGVPLQSTVTVPVTQWMKKSNGVFTVKVSGQDGRKKAEERKRNKSGGFISPSLKEKRKKKVGIKHTVDAKWQLRFFANAVSQKFVKAWTGNVWQLCSCDSFTLWFTWGGCV